MDYSFLVNRYLLNRRIVGPYKFQFHPYGGGCYNEEFLQPVILRKRDLLVDCGANVGGWTIPAADYYREVHAFEANPLFANVLTKNLRINGKRNVKVHSVALGDKIEKKTLYLYHDKSEASFYSAHLGVLGKDTIEVPVATLDSYDLTPSVVKIDTEGYEVQVVKGGLDTFHEHTPLLIIETHDPNDIQPIKQFLPEYSWNDLVNQPGHENQTILIGSRTRC